MNIFQFTSVQLYIRELGGRGGVKISEKSAYVILERSHISYGHLEEDKV